MNIFINISIYNSNDASINLDQHKRLAFTNYKNGHYSACHLLKLCTASIYVAYSAHASEFCHRTITRIFCTNLCRDTYYCTTQSSVVAFLCTALP